MSYTNRVYHFWNGKNIDGKPYVADPKLLKKADLNSSNTLLKYQIGADTFSANDLQEGIEYE